MNTKKTGLGQSLLLHRTTPDDPKRADAQAPASSEPQATRLPTRPPSLKSIYDKCTLYLAPDVNEQLDLAARIERKSRSDIATELLRTHLRTYRIERE